MDGDPAVEPEVDSFSLFLPLPYRVAFITVLGIWAWGLNLHYLHLVRIVRSPRLVLALTDCIGCSRPHTIPCPLGSTVVQPSSRDLSAGNTPDSPSSRIDSALLARNTRRQACCAIVADSPTVVPLVPHVMLPHSGQAHVAIRPSTLSLDAEKDQFGWLGGSSRWEVRRYTTGRCSYELCKGTGGSFCFYLHALFQKHNEHGQA